MTRLEEIKNEIAKEMQAEDAWVDMKHFKDGTYQSPITEKYYNRIIERYARECCIATQKKCAENGRVRRDWYNPKYYHVDKDSITNPENIVLI